jgi:hypothetical protein
MFHYNAEGATFVVQKTRQGFATNATVQYALSILLNTDVIQNTLRRRW